MYEMLTGHVPFDGDTAVAVALKHLQEDLKGPKELIPEIPNSTNAIVLNARRRVRIGDMRIWLRSSVT